MFYEESIIPAAKKQPGFKNALFLTNRNAGKFVAITIWESIQHALDNQKSGYYQKKYADSDRINEAGAASGNYSNRSKKKGTHYLSKTEHRIK